MRLASSSSSPHREALDSDSHSHLHSPSHSHHIFQQHDSRHNQLSDSKLLVPNQATITHQQHFEPQNSTLPHFPAIDTIVTIDTLMTGTQSCQSETNAENEDSVTYFSIPSPAYSATVATNPGTGKGKATATGKETASTGTGKGTGSTTQTIGGMGASLDPSAMDWSALFNTSGSTTVGNHLGPQFQVKDILRNDNDGNDDMDASDSEGGVPLNNTVDPSDSASTTSLNPSHGDFEQSHDESAHQDLVTPIDNENEQAQHLPLAQLIAPPTLPGLEPAPAPAPAAGLHPFEVHIGNSLFSMHFAGGLPAQQLSDGFESGPDVLPPPPPFQPQPQLQSQLQQGMQPVLPPNHGHFVEPASLSNPDPGMLGSHNLGLMDYIKNWALQSQPIPGLPASRRHGPDMLNFLSQSVAAVNEVSYSDLKGDHLDIQGVNWADLGVTRKEARLRRRLGYNNYINIKGSDCWTPSLNDTRLPSRESFFRFRRLQVREDVHLAHFQLRSVLACPSRSQAFYPALGRIKCVNPVSKKTEVALDLDHFSGVGSIVSSLDAAHGLLMAGTFTGDYYIKNLNTKLCSEGQITCSTSGITNHIQIHSSRASNPVAAIASNDEGFRVFDLATETFTSEVKYRFPMNCTAVSPDRRLRVMVGDHQNVLIVDADSGAVLQELRGHRDFGFACDWADDGYTVATGFQDKSLKIWDARRWCNSNGQNVPLCTIRSEMAGVRGLRFSAEGTGKRVLVAAEEADYVNIIDAQTFCSKQIIDVFSEIGGVAFTNDGQDLNVLCCDRRRGGLLQLERCGDGLEPWIGSAFKRRPRQNDWSIEPDDDRRDYRPGENYRRRPVMMDTMALF